MWLRARFYRALSTLWICITVAATLSPANAQPVTSITDYKFSNDGKLLGFGVPLHLLLYDWRAGTLAEILDPPGHRITSLPIFTTDGKSFLLVLDDQKQFGIFDLVTLKLKSIFGSDCERRGDLVFQPGDKAVVMVMQGDLTQQYLCLHDLQTGRSQIVLPKEQGFLDLHSLNFIRQDEVLFIGRDPKDPEIAAKVRSLGADPVTAFIPYRLKLGGRLEIAFPEILERSKALLAPLRPNGPTQIDVSRNGEKIVYIDRSLSEEARVEEARKYPRKYGEPYRYDLFAIEAGATRQVTHLEAFMGYSAVSYDGSTAALGLLAGEMTKEKYLNRRLRTFEPVIVDMSTGAITKTNLIARVNADPRFAPSAGK